MNGILLAAVGCLLGLFLAGCQTTGHQEARDIAVKVFPSDRGKGIHAVWVVDAATGEKLEPVMDGGARRYLPQLSPSKSWLAVEEVVGDSFATVRLFHQEAPGGFRRIPDEDFILDAWKEVAPAPDGVLGLSESRSSVAAWGDKEQCLKLKLEGTTAGGEKVDGMASVDLTKLD